MDVRYLLLYILVLSSVVCDCCVVVDFEEAFNTTFSNEFGVCIDRLRFNLGYYENLPIDGPDPQSLKYVYPDVELSCVSSFSFPMEATGVLEVNIYMEPTNPTDQMTILVNQIVPGGQDAVMGNRWIIAMDDDFFSGWRTERITLTGFGAYEGYVTLMGIAQSESIILIDSFRYIPPGTRDEDCVIYEDDTTSTITTRADIISTINTDTTESPTETTEPVTETVTTTIVTEAPTTTEIITTTTTTDTPTPTEIVTTTIATEPPTTTEIVTTTTVTDTPTPTEIVTTTIATEPPTTTEIITTTTVTDTPTPTEIVTTTIATEPPTTTEIVDTPTPTEIVTTTMATEPPTTTEIITTTTITDTPTPTEIITTSITDTTTTITEAPTTTQSTPITTESESTTITTATDNFDQTTSTYSQTITTDVGTTGTDFEIPTTESPPINPGMSGFWNAYTITMVILLIILIILIIARVSYLIGKRTRRSSQSSIISLDFGELPRPIMIPRVEKVNSEFKIPSL